MSPNSRKFVQDLPSERTSFELMFCGFSNTLGTIHVVASIHNSLALVAYKKAIRINVLKKLL